MAKLCSRVLLNLTMAFTVRSIAPRTALHRPPARVVRSVARKVLVLPLIVRAMASSSQDVQLDKNTPEEVRLQNASWCDL